MPDILAIGELGRAAGAKVETIRYYERIGLLAPPQRTSGNYRAYNGTHLKRLSFICRSRRLGFSLGQIRALLDLADQKDRPCEAIDEIAKGHLAEVERKIEDLEALRTELAGMLRRCGRGAVRDCGIVEALSPSGTWRSTTV